jgi:CrcB protein
MYAWIAVALGGAVGAVARHGVNRLVQQEWPATRFPLATLVVNLLGCCIIGGLAGLVATGRLPMSATWREFVFVGILGGFTTFSTFALDTLTLVRAGGGPPALLNVALHVMGGLGVAYAALVFVQRLGAAAR